jgi:tetrahydromethanopterin S-methyltransferase subunit F
MSGVASRQMALRTQSGYIARMKRLQLAANVAAVIGLILVFAGLFAQQPSMILKAGSWLLGGAMAAEGWILSNRRSSPARPAER